MENKQDLDKILRKISFVLQPQTKLKLQLRQILEIG